MAYIVIITDLRIIFITVENNQKEEILIRNPVIFYGEKELYYSFIKAKREIVLKIY